MFYKRTVSSTTFYVEGIKKTLQAWKKARELQPLGESVRGWCLRPAICLWFAFSQCCQFVFWGQICNFWPFL